MPPVQGVPVDAAVHYVCARLPGGRNEIAAPASQVASYPGSRASNLHPMDPSQVSAQPTAAGPPPSTPTAADRLTVAGGVVLVIGVAALAVTLVVWASGGDAPVVATVLSLLCPVGFAMCLAGLVLQVRRRRRD